MKKVGFVGARGLVGSVLLSRMREMNDFAEIDVYFFSTSQAGQPAPAVGQSTQTFLAADAWDILCSMEIILSCQGSAYTSRAYVTLRQMGWRGFWIDAASFLRLHEESLIVLPPINQSVIQQGLQRGIKTFVGGNCTVSLMLLALYGLLKEGVVEWISTMTYQAVSGAGAGAMKRLLDEIHVTAQIPAPSSIADYAVQVERSINQGNPPFLGNVLPWIDDKMPNGQSKEEWKATQEARKILQWKTPVPIDGTCVRVGVFRAHSQALTVRLTQTMHLTDIETLLQSAHPWIKWVPNDPQPTLRDLTPMAVSGTLNIAIGRVRKMLFGKRYLSLFTVGDQLLWGAAEPLRLMLKQLI